VYGGVIVRLILGLQGGDDDEVCGVEAHVCLFSYKEGLRAGRVSGSPA
jgi:hypothetical protein